MILAVHLVVKCCPVLSSWRLLPVVLRLSGESRAVFEVQDVQTTVRIKVENTNSPRFISAFAHAWAKITKAVMVPTFGFGDVHVGYERERKDGSNLVALRGSELPRYSNYV
jgi:hypothetical protein